MQFLTSLIGGSANISTSTLALALGVVLDP